MTLCRSVASVVLLLIVRWLVGGWIGWVVGGFPFSRGLLRLCSCKHWWCSGFMLFAVVVVVLLLLLVVVVVVAHHAPFLGS